MRFFDCHEHKIPKEKQVQGEGGVREEERTDEMKEEEEEEEGDSDGLTLN